MSMVAAYTLLLHVIAFSLSKKVLLLLSTWKIFEKAEVELFFPRVPTLTEVHISADDEEDGGPIEVAIESKEEKGSLEMGAVINSERVIESASDSDSSSTVDEVSRFVKGKNKCGEKRGFNRSMRIF